MSSFIASWAEAAYGALVGEGDWVRQLRAGELPLEYVLDERLLRELGLSTEDGELKQILASLRLHQLNTWGDLLKIDDRAEAVKTTGGLFEHGSELWDFISAYNKTRVTRLLSRSISRSARNGRLNVRATLDSVDVALEKLAIPGEGTRPTFKQAESQPDMRHVPCNRHAAKKVLTKIRNSGEKLAFALFVAPSGAGKTSAALEIASEIYTLWIGCGGEQYGVGTSMGAGSYADRSFVRLASDLYSKLCERFAEPYCRALEAGLTWITYLLVRLLFLIAYLDRTESPSPYQWLRLQETYDFQMSLGTFFRSIEGLSIPLSREGLEQALIEARCMLKQRLERSHQPDELLICVDKLESAFKRVPMFFVRGVFGSQMHTTLRSFISPMSSALHAFSKISRWHVVMTTTDSMMASPDEVHSDFECELDVMRAESFPLADERSVMKIVQEVRPRRVGCVSCISRLSPRMGYRAFGDENLCGSCDMQTQE